MDRFNCHVERRKLITKIQPGRRLARQQWWATVPCGAPALFTSSPLALVGVCRSCATGWTHRENYPTEAGLRTVAFARWALGRAIASQLRPRGRALPANDPGRYVEWLVTMTEHDERGAIHWSRELASLLAVAPAGTFTTHELDYAPRPPGYPRTGRTPPNLKRIRWSLHHVVELGVLAYVYLYTSEREPIPAEALAELAAVRPHVPELESDITSAMVLHHDAALRAAEVA